MMQRRFNANCLRLSSIWEGSTGAFLAYVLSVSVRPLKNVTPQLRCVKPGNASKLPLRLNRSLSSSVEGLIEFARLQFRKWRDAFKQNYELVLHYPFVRGRGTSIL